MDRRQFALFSVVAFTLAGRAKAAAEAPPTNWDGLVRVPSKKLKFVYLAPNVDFRKYNQVMIDPTEISFDQNWIKKFNEQEIDPQNWISASDIRNNVADGGKRASAIFDKAFADGGFPVVTAPGPDVLRVRTAILNIVVASPDLMTSMGRTFTNSSAAGSAMLVLELRDSQSNALLGRAVDSRLAGDDGVILRNSVTNWSDFQQLAKTWGKVAAAGLNELKTLSPVPAGGAPG